MRKMEFKINFDNWLIIYYGVDWDYVDNNYSAYQADEAWSEYVDWKDQFYSDGTDPSWTDQEYTALVEWYYPEGGDSEYDEYDDIIITALYKKELKDM